MTDPVRPPLKVQIASLAILLPNLVLWCIAAYFVHRSTYDDLEVIGCWLAGWVLLHIFSQLLGTFGPNLQALALARVFVLISIGMITWIALLLPWQFGLLVVPASLLLWLCHDTIQRWRRELKAFCERESVQPARWRLSLKEIFGLMIVTGVLAGLWSYFYR